MNGGRVRARHRPQPRRLMNGQRHAPAPASTVLRLTGARAPAAGRRGHGHVPRPATQERRHRLSLPEPKCSLRAPGRQPGPSGHSVRFLKDPPQNVHVVGAFARGSLAGRPLLCLPHSPE